MNHDFDLDLLPHERLFNVLSTVVGLGLALVGVPVLLVSAALHGNAWQVTGNAVYGATLVVGYTSFTLYHLFKAGRHRTLFKILDHAAIYLLIAGTYTPFTLVNLRGHGGLALFVTIWAMAAAGVVFKAFWVYRFRIVAPALYVVMGWMLLVAVKPALIYIAPAGLGLILAGGIAYTGGLLFYGIGKIPYHHALWHLCVVAGSLCHFLAVLWYVPSV